MRGGSPAETTTGYSRVVLMMLRWFEESGDVFAGDRAGGEAYFCGHVLADGEAVGDGVAVVLGRHALPCFEGLLVAWTGPFPPGGRRTGRLRSRSHFCAVRTLTPRSEAISFQPLSSRFGTLPDGRVPQVRYDS